MLLLRGILSRCEKLPKWNLIIEEPAGIEEEIYAPPVDTKTDARLEATWLQVMRFLIARLKE